MLAFADGMTPLAVAAAGTARRQGCHGGASHPRLSRLWIKL